LASTRHFLLWSLTAALVLALLILVAMPKLARPATAVVLALAAFSFFGGYERLREGIRKPFLIHSYIFSNGLRVADIPDVNASGVLARSGWAGLAAVEDPASTGRQVFRAQCASCHTIDGYLGIRQLLPTVAEFRAVAAGEGTAVYRAECAACHTDVSADEMGEMLPSPEEIDADREMIAELNSGMIYGTLVRLAEMGEGYEAADHTHMIDTSGFDYPYMPPFVGNEGEMEALAAYLAGLVDDRPEQLAMKGGQ